MKQFELPLNRADYIPQIWEGTYCGNIFIQYTLLHKPRVGFLHRRTICTPPCDWGAPVDKK